MRVLLIVAGAIATGCAPSADSARSTRLDTAEFERALSQCSRASVAGAHAAWRLTPSQARQVDRAFAQLGQPPSWRGELAPAAYYRQYLGITVAGRRLVYVNAFAPDVLRLRAAPPVVPRPSWRVQAVTACDGGNWFWGAVFDPVTGKVEQVEFNGLG